MGFKSFADKFSLTLNDEITCIVGPNGSGKSNVVDAVRWVLGEQSVKSLRGDGAMSDVIFQGSKSRKPLNVASVMLVFDNSDHYLKIPYDEVSIKRKIFRTGENEYYLNGEKCRLKDIMDLFLDSGIGRESFNIISQGEVQRILSNSPYDRRIIFEEAAGVLKYKKRKEEAFRKLEKTKINLDRVEDIIKELKERVEPLKEQSSKAKKYLEHKENLEKHDIALLCYDITKMSDTYQGVKKKITTLEEELRDLSSNSSLQDVNRLKLKEDITHLEEELTKYNQDYVEKTKQVEGLNRDLSLMKERSKYDRNSSMVKENMQLLLEKKLASQNEVSKSQEEVRLLQSTRETIEKQILKEEDKYQEKRKKKDQIFNDFNALDKETLLIDNKILSKKNALETASGVPSSVKSVLSNPKLKGIHQTLANLLTIDSTYVKALETAIFSSKYYLVVDDEQAAKDAIFYLKNNHLGRVTFLPISTMKPREVDKETLASLQNDSSFVDVLSNLVSYTDTYHVIILNQLGNILVAKDLDGATKLAKKINYRYRIITLDGDVINVGGSLTGGSSSPSYSAITIRQEIEELSLEKTKKMEQKETLDQKLQQLNSELSSFLEKLGTIRQSLLQANQELEQKQMNLSKLENELSSLTKELSDLEHLQQDSLSEEETKLTKDYYQALEEVEHLKLKLQEIKKQLDILHQKEQEEDATMKLQSSLYRSKEQELKQLEISHSKLDVKLDHLLQTLSEEYSLTYEKAKVDYPLEIDPNVARELVNSSKAAIKALGMVNLASIDEYEEVNERYTFLTNQKNDLDQAKETLLSIINQMDEVMKENFMTTFNQVKEEFKLVFRELFNGGSADLTLTEPNDILTTGIEIVASPPGKKLKSISLLSGGEKTLTAISLLFAILNVRTVPFCLFDEVEAALDEANVDQFGKYLDHYKEKTQFLIITHKKKTMEYAKTLYGITMQESGVSKLVSVKLDDAIEVV